MSVMFHEEVSKLKLQIVELQELNTTHERNAQRLSQLLTEEKQVNTSLEKTVQGLNSDLEAEKLARSTAQRLVDRLQNAETAAAEAQSERNALQTQNERLQGELTKTKAELMTQTGLGKALSAQIQHLTEQVGPLEALVAALKVREVSEKTISEQLGLLRIGDSTD